MQLVLHYARNFHLLSTIIGVGILFLCAQVSIPLNPVPITLHTAAVLFIGLTFSKPDAMWAISSYIALGAMGAPIFTNFSGGFLKIMGPTGGYLLGFLAAIWLMCALRERIEKLGTKEMILLAVVGNAMVYVVGLPWLSAFVGWEMAVTAGLLPFIIPGILKAVLVASAVRYMRK